MTDRADGTGLLVTVGGELDIAGVGEVRQPVDELLTREPQPLLLDLSDLAFLDSSGVAILIRLANHFGTVQTRSATRPVRRVIEVLGLADRLGLAAA